jgi:hypothetical protein
VRCVRRERRRSRFTQTERGRFLAVVVESRRLAVECFEAKRVTVDVSDSATPRFDGQLATRGREGLELYASSIHVVLVRPLEVAGGDCATGEKRDVGG